MSQWKQVPTEWQDLMHDLPNDIWQKINLNILSDKEKGLDIYPKDIFNALKLVKPNEVKVVILGQDPYHNIINHIPQAHGLAFSVPKGLPIPPSLQNIDKELYQSLNIPIPQHGCLENWTTQGVLLLNSILTVIIHQPASHANIGWQEFTDFLLKKLSVQYSNIVWMLWGKYAQNKQQNIDEKTHLILKAPHPSPLSAHRGFIGCGHFKKCNEYLSLWGKQAIDWHR